MPISRSSAWWAGSQGLAEITAMRSPLRKTVAVLAQASDAAGRSRRPAPGSRGRAGLPSSAASRNGRPAIRRTHRDGSRSARSWAPSRARSRPVRLSSSLSRAQRPFEQLGERLLRRRAERTPVFAVVGRRNRWGQAGHCERTDFFDFLELGGAGGFFVVVVKVERFGAVVDQGGGFVVRSAPPPRRATEWSARRIGRSARARAFW